MKVFLMSIALGVLFTTNAFAGTSPSKKGKETQKITVFAPEDAVQVMGVFTVSGRNRIKCPKKQPLCVTINPDAGDVIVMRGYDPGNQEVIFEAYLLDYTLTVEDTDTDVITYTEVE